MYINALRSASYVDLKVLLFFAYNMFLCSEDSFTYVRMYFHFCIMYDDFSASFSRKFHK